jgi:hypothetical protein
MNFIFENEKNYFQIIFLIYATLYAVFFPFILFDQFNLCLYFYYHFLNKKIILIKKFSKYNRVNVSSFEI